MLFSTVLTNVKTCFVVPVGILSSYCRDLSLIKTPPPRLLMLETLSAPAQPPPPPAY